MRISKVRITRPAGAMTGLDYLTASQAREAAEHDRAVACFDEVLLLAVLADLGKRKAYDRRDHEQRWIMSRKAAVLRSLDTKGAFR